MGSRRRIGKLKWRNRRANHGRKPCKGHIRSQFKAAKQK